MYQPVDSIQDLDLNRRKYCTPQNDASIAFASVRA